MTKVLTLFAALLLAASPAVAQQSVAVAGGQSPAQAQAQPAQEIRSPTVHVSRAEVRQSVQANEERLARAQVRSTSWWWIVAAVAAGVIVAAIVL